VTATYVAVDLETLQAAVARAGRTDWIVTAFEAGDLHPALGFSNTSGCWQVLSWSRTQPCGIWTVSSDGHAACRVTAET
jgi:hypothetical protein